MPAAKLITLHAGDLEADFAPGVGMVGVALRHRGDELLDQRRGLAAYADAGKTMGIPLLHPWANRLAVPGYAVDGREVRLDLDSPLVRVDDNGLPIHGLLGASPHWQLASPPSSALTATLDFGAHPDLLALFPFPHELAFEARLDPVGLEIALTVRPTGDVAVPVSFGFHPYLRLPGSDRSSWRLGLPERRHLATDEHGIPTGEVTPETAESLVLAARGFDDGYDGVAEGAEFTAADDDRTLTVTFLRGYTAAQVFSPPGAQFICFEPMTAPTNALRSGEGLRRIAPGDEFTAAFRIDVA